ncbi:MAG: class I SAM-dependent methyltransferase [Leptolyngbyaceae cyanobacterium bins.59]|nr:class I SAM-dependent methyltransferase [Leptolyngbyaceae cyanobacterium bins.59]
MVSASKLQKIEYGDFQTPPELAEQVCQKLIEIGIQPDVIIEPTCGVGNFIQASAKAFPSARKIFGFEINATYFEQLANDNQLITDPRIQIEQGDFFQLDWEAFTKTIDGKILVLGNFPWVTNAQQGVITGKNLPLKTNFQSHQGFDAMTGKSNFDISEWMLIRIIQGLQKRPSALAMLCKTSVSRKLLNYLFTQKLNLKYCATYQIDAKKHFGAIVDACLLFCTFEPETHHYFCDVFDRLDSSSYSRIGYEEGILIKDLNTFQKLKDLSDPNPKKQWRSGIKHDCAKVMILHKTDGGYLNGFREVIELEETLIFPFMKGSDVAQGRIEGGDRFVLITQQSIHESTELIQMLAPKTWNYLESCAKQLEARKSKIYQNAPRFSIFGVGSYTFAPWKIAICGLYKKLHFQLIGPRNHKPVIFDDTVYFLAFEDQQTADRTFALLTSAFATDFYHSLIFWDEKRPIKTSILNRLNLEVLAQRLNNITQTDG